MQQDSDMDVVDNVHCAPTDYTLGYIQMIKPKWIQGSIKVT